MIGRQLRVFRGLPGARSRPAGARYSPDISPEFPPVRRLLHRLTACRAGQGHQARIAHFRAAQQFVQRNIRARSPCPARARHRPWPACADLPRSFSGAPVRVRLSRAFASNACQRISSTRPSRRPVSVRRMSALSSRNCKRYSARLVNMRYGSETPRVIRSSTITPR